MMSNGSSGFRRLSAIATAWCLALLAYATASARGDDVGRHANRPFTPTSQHTTKQVAGWTVHVNNRLLDEQPKLARRALKRLEDKLDDVVAVVPAAAVAELRKVPIWLGLDDGYAPCAEYHPSREFLLAHGYNPDKAKCLEIGNAQKFVDWSVDQPAMILHELAHAYHDQVLDFDQPAIKAAYAAAVQSGSYDHVLRFSGKTERHYGLTDHKEYFAEATEAYFSTNDFFPFVRAELHRLDPRIEAILSDLWYLQPRSAGPRREATAKRRLRPAAQSRKTPSAE